MLDITFWELTGAVALASGISLAVLWITGRFLLPQQEVLPNSNDTPDNAAFLFVNDVLSDHDVGGAKLADSLAQRLEHWPDFRDWLGNRFGSLPQNLSQLSADYVETFAARGPEDGARLVISSIGDARRVTLTDPARLDVIDRHAAINASRALGNHDRALQNTPCAICMTDTRGQLIWQNTAFGDMPQDLKDAVLNPDNSDAADNAATTGARIPGNSRGNAHGYEIRTTASDDLTVHYATDISAVIQAETAQKEFVQTLTKTFANLTIGLAVFDRNRQLALFNPALVDLTALPVDFLSARPRMMSFFDMLRDRQIMPEPKNYANWRTQVNDMIETASGGLYLETWSLPTGLTYRVTGRPHPDGAMAFLFEDISDEILLTRRFRSQLDIRQSVLDRLDDAVAVIARNNVLMFCNRACRTMLGIDPDSSLAEMSLHDLMSACERAFPGAEFWEDTESRIAGTTQVLSDSRSLSAGDVHIQCHVTALTAGAVMVRLSPSQDTAIQVKQPVSA